jgi:uncharacterized protein YjiS (DUF1127 family)
LLRHQEKTMSTPIHPAPTATAMPRLPSAFIEAIRALRALAQRVDAWLEARKRAREDRYALAGMSDRELLDIGIDRGSVSDVADGTWTREYPR